MGEQRDAPAAQRRAQGGVGEQPVDAEFHDHYALEHDQEKWKPVFRKDHAPLEN